MQPTRIVVEWQQAGESWIRSRIFRGSFRSALDAALDWADDRQEVSRWTFVRPARSGEWGEA